MRRVFSFMLALSLCIAAGGCWWHDREGYERDRQRGYGEHERQDYGDHDRGYGDHDRGAYGDHEGRSSDFRSR